MVAVGGVLGLQERRGIQLVVGHGRQRRSVVALDGYRRGARRGALEETPGGAVAVGLLHPLHGGSTHGAVPPAPDGWLAQHGFGRNPAEVGQQPFAGRPGLLGRRGRRLPVAYMLLAVVAVHIAASLCPYRCATLLLLPPAVARLYYYIS